MKEFWNERYAAKEYIYGKEPNGFFKEMIDDLPPGKILLPAEGEGRNAIYAAKKGWSVSAFDQSSEGRQKALRLAEENNVSIEYTIDSFEYFTANEGSYDVIALIYSHVVPTIRNVFHKSLKRYLKKNGIILLEAFNKKQINNNSGGPKNIDMLFSVEMLKADFYGLKIELLEEYEKEVNESEAHFGKAEIIRLIAKKQ